MIARFFFGLPLGFFLTAGAGLAAEPGQPWLRTESLRRETAAREPGRDGAPEALAAHGRLCRERGLLAEMLEFAAPARAGGAAPAEVLDLLGLAPGAAGLQPREVATPEATPAYAALAAPAPATRAKVLSARFRDIRVANKATYFDIWSDLDEAALKPYLSTLTEHYSQLRNRFRADLWSNIDVLIYGNRSDYLIDYLRETGRSGENILGYFVPGRRLLVFYDDPEDTASVQLTARHECTHLLIDLGFGGAPVPRWLHEGLACYAAADGDAARGRATAALLLTFLDLADRGKLASTESLLQIDSSTITYEHYAAAWGLVHFLNQGARAKLFQGFLSELRESLDPGSSNADAEKQASALFRAAFGEDLDGLDRSARSYFRTELRLERPEQFLDLAEAALEQLGLAKDGAAAERLLDVAQCALEGAAVEPKLDSPRRMAALRCAVERAARARESAELGRQLLRRVRTELALLPARGPVGPRMRLVRRALDVARESAGVRRSAAPFDLVRAFQQQAERSAGAARDTLSALASLAEQLLAGEFATCGAALAAAPAYRGAAVEWLCLAAEAAPARVREIFPYLQLQVEADPDDRALAALGVAYAALGKGPYGRRLIAEGKAISPRPRDLEAFERYAAGK